MRKVLAELTFRVTETCDNGNERTFNKKVYASPIYTDKDGHKRNNSITRTVPLAIAALKEEHYYNIEFISVKPTKFLFVEDFTINY